MTPREMSFGEVNGVGELDYLAQEVGARSEAFDNAGNLLATRPGTPEVVCGSGIARSFCIFDEADFGLIVGHQAAIVNHY